MKNPQLLYNTILIFYYSNKCGKKKSLNHPIFKHVPSSWNIGYTMYMPLPRVMITYQKNDEHHNTTIKH